MRCSSSKMKERFPSNYSLNTCLHDNLANRRHYVAIHEVLTFRQDAVGALHKHVFPFSQNEYRGHQNLKQLI